MIFLKDNAYLERKLTFDDIKPRLLGYYEQSPCIDTVTDNNRSLGNLPWLDIGICSSQLSGSQK